ncbi:GRIP1-associated protein 1-like isoform X2 [Ruditapes philippinarum]|uniref:GRIP1-associated protein 1-like isoform X2 n=1 Tax=Ruditapes philippinarum TaxID=129788 RepID=UPI00295B72C0|nr:GRIP1-associated protein 1-like isoform X2 [Ruditapes philippinarum]
MASGLSEDEFHRMQLQLIELRTAKYELEATNKKQEREIQSLKDAAETSEKELQKAQKAINKSKKAKEVEMLLQEADNLQMKLQSQEDDFRVQNQTLMQELTNLVSSNEDLEKQLSELKENKGGNQGASEVSSHLEDEVRRLQAQNAALQKSLSEMQSKTLSKSENEDDSEAAESVTTSDGNITDVETLQKKIDELKLSVDTEAEEKRMIKQKLSENEESHKEEVKSLKDELEKLTEKLKKKQESYVQLQGEKESSFRDLNAKLIELHFSKDRDQKYYTDQISKLQQEIAKYQKIQDEIKSNSDQAIKQLQNKMAQMQQQESQKASEMASQQLLHLQQDRDKQIQSAQEANKLAEKRKAMLDELAIEYQKDGDKHREQMLTMENDYEVRLKTLQQKLDQEQKKHAELEKLKSTLEEKQTEINSLSEKCGWLERKLSDTEGSLDKTLDENETTLLSLKTDHEEEITSLKTEHSTQIEQLTNTFQAEIKSLKESEESQKQVITNLEEEVKKFKQEIKDGVNEKKVHEKKGKSVLKDLKKQLHAERKRGDKLQERLQEVLSNGSHNKSIEDLFRTPDMMSDSWREDQSSVSSWSGGGTLASYGTNPSVMSTSPQSSPMSPSSEFPGTVRNEGLENESKELLGRLAAVQQEKWDLEEKVRHLETSTAAMANDLIEKAKIIEHYVMESRTDMKHNNSQPDDKITFKKVLDLVNKTDEHGLREMNKKLQNMLEETLTKNMHLQKDLETMSQEVVRLSKLPHHVDARVKNSEQNSITPKQDSSNCSNNTDGQTDSIKCSTVNGAVS